MKGVIVLAALAAVLACANVAVTLTHGKSSGVTSCAQIAYDYVKQVADANGLHVDSYKLLACRLVDANHAVARVDVTVDQYGLTQSVTLVYHLTRSPWQMSVNAVGS